MKKTKKNILFPVLIILTVSLLIGTIAAYLLGQDRRDNIFKIGEPINNTVYYRLMDSYGLNTNAEGRQNIVFYQGILPMFQNQEFYLDYESSYFALSDAEYASQVTMPNGFFLNSYYYRNGERYAAGNDKENERQFINVPAAYVDVFKNNKKTELLYKRKLVEADKDVTPYQIGMTAEIQDGKRVAAVKYPNAETFEQTNEKFEFYYDFEPIDYTIIFDLNPDHMKDGKYEGYPYIDGIPIKGKTDEQIQKAAENLKLIVPTDEKISNNAGDRFNRYYYGTYNVLEGKQFPEAKWEGGMEYQFLGWRIVSDDHYDENTDEYTNFNYKKNDNYDINDDEYVHGVNCWVAYENNPVYLDKNGNPSYYMDNGIQIDLTSDKIKLFTKDNYFYQLDKELNGKKVRYYYGSYKGGTPNGETLLYPLNFLTESESLTPVTQEKIYSTEEVIALLNKRSTGNIELQAQWAVPDLVVKFDTSYIKANFEGGTTANQLTYKWNTDAMRYELTSGTYKEPVFKFRGWAKNGGDALAYTDIENCPYIQFWTTDKHLDTINPESDDWTVEEDSLFKMSLNSNRDGMVQLSNGEKVFISEAISMTAPQYPASGAEVATFYGFMKETVYDGRSIQKIDISALKTAGKITQESAGGDSHYQLTVYGYIKPMVILQTAPEVTIKEVREAKTHSYNNSSVEFDYVANEKTLGTEFSFHRASFSDDYLDNYFDPRIDEKQTGDRGWVTDATAGQKNISRGKNYSIPTKSKMGSTTQDAVFTGYQTYYYDNGRDPSNANHAALEYDSVADHYFTLQGLNIITGEIADNFIAVNDHRDETGNPNIYLTHVTDHRYALKSNYEHNFSSGSKETKIYLRPIWVNTDDNDVSHITLSFDKGTGGGPNGTMYDITLNKKDTSILNYLPSCTFTNVNYSFQYWTCNVTQVSTLQEVLNKVGNNATTATLVANWGADGFNIIYLPNDTNANPSETQKDNTIRKNTNTTTWLTGNVKKNLFTVSGKSFVAWNTKTDGTGDFYFADQTVYETDRNIKLYPDDAEDKNVPKLKLYAMWTNANSSITFNANGGKFRGGEAINNVHYAGLVPANEYNLSYTGVYETPVREGYKFLGWADSETNAESKTILSESEINTDNGRLGSVLTESKTYYAVWSEYNIPVYFSPNGGFGSITSERIGTTGKLQLKSQEILKNMIPAQGFTKYKTENNQVVTEKDENEKDVPVKMILAGWSLSPSGDIFVEDGGLLEYNDVLNEYKKITGQQSYDLDSITLYAVWIDSCTVTFVPNGGIGTPKDEQTNEFGRVRMKNASVYAFENGRYVFLGWSDEPDGWIDADAKFYAVNDYAAFYKDTTLYAQWFYYQEDFNGKILNDFHMSSNWTRIFAADESKVTVGNGLTLTGTSANIVFNRYSTTLAQDYIAEAKVTFTSSANIFGFTTANDNTSVFKMESTAKNPEIFTLNGVADNQVTLDLTQPHNVKVVVRSGNSYVYIDDTLVSQSSHSGLLYGAYASGSLTLDNLSVYNMNQLADVIFHSGTDADESYSETIYFVPYTVTEPTGFTAPTGKEFAGWSITEGGEVEYKAGDELSEENVKTLNKDLYAVWSEVYTIVYDKNKELIKMCLGNDATGETANSVLNVLTGGTLRKNSFTIDARNTKFMGWNTKYDGTGIMFNESAEIHFDDFSSNNFSEADAQKFNDEKIITLYAIWSRLYLRFYPYENDESNVTNRGAFKDNSDYKDITYGGRAAISYDPEIMLPVWEGHDFLYWYKNTNTTTEVIDSQTGIASSISIFQNSRSGVMTYENGNRIYARWKKSNGTHITYHSDRTTPANDQTITQYIAEGETGTIKTGSANLFEGLTGKVFECWTNKNGNKYTATELIGKTGDVEELDLYAQWKEGFKITYKSGKNGIGADVTQEADKNDVVTLKTIGTAATQCDFTNSDGAKFLGWSKTEEAWKDNTAVIYADGASIAKGTFTTDTTLYAQWYIYNDDYSSTGLTPVWTTKDAVAKQSNGSVTITNSVNGNRYAYEYFKKANSEKNKYENMLSNANAYIISTDFSFVVPSASVNLGNAYQKRSEIAIIQGIPETLDQTKDGSEGITDYYVKLRVEYENETASGNDKATGRYYVFVNGVEKAIDTVNLGANTGTCRLEVLIDKNTGTETIRIFQGTATEPTWEKTVGVDTSSNASGIYAQLTKNTTTTITIDNTKVYVPTPIATLTLNDGLTEPKTEEYSVYSSPYTIPKTDLKNGNKEVVYWKDIEGNVYFTGESITISADMELTAVWGNKAFENTSLSTSNITNVNGTNLITAKDETDYVTLTGAGNSRGAEVKFDSNDLKKLDTSKPYRIDVDILLNPKYNNYDATFAIVYGDSAPDYYGLNQSTPTSGQTINGGIEDNFILKLSNYSASASSSTSASWKINGKYSNTNNLFETISDIETGNISKTEWAKISILVDGEKAHLVITQNNKVIASKNITTQVTGGNLYGLYTCIRGATSTVSIKDYAVYSVDSNTTAGARAATFFWDDEDDWNIWEAEEATTTTTEQTSVTFEMESTTTESTTTEITTESVITETTSVTETTTETSDTSTSTEITTETTETTSTETTITIPFETDVITDDTRDDESKTTTTTVTETTD